MEYLPRIIEKNLEKWLEKGYVILIKGARQTGKTTLLKHFQQKYGGSYVSLEFEEYAEALVKDPLSFGKRFVEKVEVKKINKTELLTFPCYWF